MSKKNKEINFIESYPWFDNDLFELILRKEFKTSDVVVVTNVTLDVPQGKGANYGSHIIKACVSYERNDIEKNHSFIIKTAYDPQIVGIFEKEITIYQEILPAVYKLLEIIDDNTKLTPKCYHTDMKRSFMIFEDLTELGYKNVDLSLGLDVEQTILILKKAAKWHACNSIFLLKNESIAKLYKPTINEEHKFIIPNTIIALATVTQQNGHELLAKKILKYSETAYEQSLEAMQSCANDFNVICHGDLWSNNVMFRHDENGKPIDVLFLDFEFSFYSSPMLDVIDAVFASPHRNNRECDWEELVQLYFKELNKILINLKYPKKIPTLNDLECVRQKRLFYGLPRAFLGLSLRNLGDLYDENVIGKFMGSTLENIEFRQYAMSNPIIKNDLNYFIEYFNKYHCFDCE